MGIYHIGKKLVHVTSNNPLLLSLKKRQYEKKFLQNRDLNLFKGIYKSFSEASNAIRQESAISYDNAQAAGMYKDAYQSLGPGDYPNLFWLSKLIKHNRTLFDFGGHIGVKYYNYSQYLDLESNFQWITYDLPAVVKEGRRYASERGQCPHLSFADNQEQASGIDIFCAFGSLQYIDIDIVKYFSSLDKKPKNLLITIPTSNKETYYTVNSIGTAFCPYVIRNEQEFINSLQSLGYKLKQSWDIAEKKCEIPYEDGYSLDHYRGFFLIL